MSLTSRRTVMARKRYKPEEIVAKLRQRLLGYMDLHWEVLLVHLLNFRWAYPSEREHVPRWLMDELLGRLEQQLDLPPARVKTCRGRLFSQIDYAAAVKEWGFVDETEGNE